MKTGIDGFDELLGGGLDERSAVLIYGPPFAGKKPFLMQYAYTQLTAGNPVIITLTDFGADDWVKMMQKGGWDPTPFEEKGLLQYVDCFSEREGGMLTEDKRRKACVYCESVDLNSISLAISEAYENVADKGEKKAMTFHSVSTLLQNVAPNTVFLFLQFLTGKLKKGGVTAMLTLEAGMHDEKEVKSVEHLMNGMIEIQDNKLKARGFIDAKTQDWVNYELDSKGIHVHPKKG